MSNNQMCACCCCMNLTFLCVFILKDFGAEDRAKENKQKQMKELKVGSNHALISPSKSLRPWEEDDMDSIKVHTSKSSPGIVVLSNVENISENFQYLSPAFWKFFK